MHRRGRLCFERLQFVVWLALTTCTALRPIASCAVTVCFSKHDTSQRISDFYTRARSCVNARILRQRGEHGAVDACGLTLECCGLTQPYDGAARRAVCGRIEPRPSRAVSSHRTPKTSRRQCQEVGENLLPALGEDGFWVELDAPDRELLVADTHDFEFGTGFSDDLQRIR